MHKELLRFDIDSRVKNVMGYTLRTIYMARSRHRMELPARCGEVAHNNHASAGAVSDFLVVRPECCSIRAEVFGPATSLVASSKCLNYLIISHFVPRL